MPNSPYASVALIAVLVLLMYFVVLRPQRKRQQQQAQTLAAIEPGTRVMLTSGIFATVIAVGEKQMVVETSPGQRLTILKQAMSRAVPAGDEDAPDVLNTNTNAATGAAGYGADADGTSGAGGMVDGAAGYTDTTTPDAGQGYDRPTYTDVPVEQATSGGTVWPPEASGRAYPDATSDLSAGEAGRDEGWSAGPAATWSAGTEASDRAAGQQDGREAGGSRSEDANRSTSSDNQSNRD